MCDRAVEISVKMLAMLCLAAVVEAAPPACTTQFQYDCLYGPSGVAFDAAGNLFIADTFNQLIREMTGQGR